MLPNSYLNIYLVNIMDLVSAIPSNIIIIIQNIFPKSGDLIPTLTITIFIKTIFPKGGDISHYYLLW